jgi:Ca2+-binding RTX toxin-like protein
LKGPTGGTTALSTATDTISVVIADVIGTSGVDTVTGTTGSDVILANGGADVISTGDGNDTVVLNASNVTELSATNAMLIDGGAGVNLLRLVSAPGVTLDLSAVAAKVTHFSVVDVTGNGSNTVKLSLNDVLNLSGAVDNAATVDVDESKMVVVKGEAGDVLNLTDRVNWQAVTTGELGASLASTYGAAYGFASGRTYTHYSQGGAHLYVDELITHPV